MFTFVVGVVVGIVLTLCTVVAGLAWLLLDIRWSADASTAPVSAARASLSTIVLSSSAWPMSRLRDPGCAKASLQWSRNGSETADWLNQVMTRVFTDLAEMPDVQRRIQDMLQAQLAALALPASVAPIQLTHLDLGSQPPLVADVRTVSNSLREVSTYLTLEYNGSATMALSTAILVNFPHPGFASLPIELSITLTSLRLPLLLRIGGTSNPQCELGLAEDPAWTLGVGTLIGRSLKNATKICDIINYQVQQAAARYGSVKAMFHLPLLGRPLGMRLSGLGTSVGAEDASQSRAKEAAMAPVSDGLALGKEDAQQGGDVEGAGVGQLSHVGGVGGSDGSNGCSDDKDEGHDGGEGDDHDGATTTFQKDSVSLDEDHNEDAPGFDTSSMHE